MPPRWCELVSSHLRREMREVATRWSLQPALSQGIAVIFKMPEPSLLASPGPQAQGRPVPTPCAVRSQGCGVPGAEPWCLRWGSQPVMPLVFTLPRVTSRRKEPSEPDVGLPRAADHGQDRCTALPPSGSIFKYGLTSSDPRCHRILLEPRATEGLHV